MRECGLLSSCDRGGWRPGRALIPTAQSGLAGKGCLDEVEVNVRREDDDVVEDDCSITTKHENQAGGRNGEILASALT